LSTRSLNRALGVLGSIAGGGAAIGLFLGGVLTEFVAWELIFFVNVPIGLGVLLIGLILVERLVLEQSLCEGIELVAVLPQQRDLLVRLVDDPSHLLVDQLLRALRDLGGAGQQPTASVDGG